MKRKMILLLLFTPILLSAIYIGGLVNLDDTQNNSGVLVTVYSITGDTIYESITNYRGFYCVDVRDGAFIVRFGKRFYKSYKTQTRIIFNNTWIKLVTLNAID